MKKTISLFLIILLLAGCANASTLEGSNVSTQPTQDSSQTQKNAETLSKEELLAGSVKGCIEEKDAGKAFLCFEKYLKDRVMAVSPEEAMAELKILYEASAQVRNYCHPLVHSIGHAAVDKYPVLSEAYKHGDDYCWSGYYHGVMEQYVGNIGLDNLPKEMKNICSTIPGKENYSFDYYNCVHGLGHGVMAITNDQLFDALHLCDNLEGDWEKSSCHSGVFMENVIIDGRNHKTEYLKPEDPVYPCNAVEESYKETCYLMQTSYMLKVYHYDFAKVFDTCSKVEENYRVTCYRSLGRDASGSSVSDIKQTKDKCSLGTTYEQKSECITGAVKDFISYFHSDVQAKNLCNALDDRKMVQSCLETAEDYYRYF